MHTNNFPGSYQLYVQVGKVTLLVIYSSLQDCLCLLRPKGHHHGWWICKLRRKDFGEDWKADLEIFVSCLYVSTVLVHVMKEGPSCNVRFPLPDC